METNLESLPDELLFDILVCLPADLLRDIARLVCRKWGHIIRSDAFISTHIQQYSSYGLVLSLPYSHPHAIYVTATRGRIETSELSCIHNRKLIATSCNGLALHYNSPSLHVVNPATKQFVRLPSTSVPRRYYYQSSIAYSVASMEYKVTLQYKDRHYSTCLDIVTVGVNKSWRRVNISYIPKHFWSVFFDSSPLSSEGFLHWANDRYCLTMNVETEMITWTKAPISTDHDHRGWYSYYYLSTGRYITVLAKCCSELSWEVWEMRPAESGDQWRKGVLANIDLEPQRGKFRQQFGYDDREHDLKPVGWVKYPEVLALCLRGRELSTYIFYNLGTDEINARPIKLTRDLWGPDYTALVHRNGLVWLTQD